jgi:pimeloyl-ACP methyl ester carboxylesterase
VPSSLRSSLYVGVRPGWDSCHRSRPGRPPPAQHLEVCADAGRAEDVGSTLVLMSLGVLVVLSGLGGSAEEWEGAARALGWPMEMGARLPPAGSVVVGHSSGAVGAMKLAVAHAARVDAVVLTSGFFPPARGGRTAAATVADYLRHRACFARDVARRKRLPRPTRRGGRELASLARLGLRPERFHAIADNVRCPLLVVHGDADHVVPVAFARAALTRHPRWAYREIRDGGHFLHRDRPEVWAEIVAAWLEPPTP